MPRGDKSSYTSKQKRQARHIEAGYEKRGVRKKTAESRAWATVNKLDGGGKKKRSGAARTAVILFGLAAMLAGCKTHYRRSASVDPAFPPAPPNPINAPDTYSK
ncbi:MAG: hypothetical protein JWQ04_605 [Pedosphaera sp.]|nr:hypothetical protein [Pedosphaera sp.]